MLWAVRLLPCISDDEGICQHFSDKTSSDADLADLCDWMNRDLNSSSPVLSSMNLAGSLRLFTAVPLVVHPQFESENLRKRVQLGYELYHCGSEESFAATMRKLRAEVVIFEYARCFFTPYLLDDRRKNCNAKRHKAEDQLCVKLHARSRHFKLVFTNGGYGVFRLRDRPLPPWKDGQEPTPTDVAKWLGEAETWHEYVQDCQRAQPGCGARLLEAAAAFEHGLRRKPAAQVLRRLAESRFPDDGYVAFYLARHFDYDAGDPKRARPYYSRAVQQLPNNPAVLREYLMFMDVAEKDAAGIASFLRERQVRRDGGLLPLLDLEGAGVGGLLCEAAVSAKNSRGLSAFGDRLWAKALRLAPLSECVKTNWQLVYGEPHAYEESHSRWRKVALLLRGGVQHEVGPHHQPTVRFLGNLSLQLRPLRRL